MLKIGVLGAGHLGKIHLRLLQQSEKYELVGFYDPNQENAEKTGQCTAQVQDHNACLPDTEIPSTDEE